MKRFRKIILISALILSLSLGVAACGETENQGGVDQEGVEQGGAQGSEQNQDSQGSQGNQGSQGSGGTQDPGSSGSQGSQGNQGNQGSQGDKEPDEKEPDQGDEKDPEQGGEKEPEGGQGDKEPDEKEPEQGGEKTPEQGEEKEPDEKEPEKGEEGEKHQHEYVFTITQEATCDAAGYKTGRCACGAETTERIPEKGHSFGAVQTDRDGKKYRICSVCGARDEMEETVSYRITIKAEEGCSFAISEKTQVFIYKNSNVYKIVKEVEETLTVELPRGKYVVRADYLGDPYIQTSYCEMSEDKPFCEILIGDNPDYDAAIQGKVNVGDKMFDFLVKDTTKTPDEYVRLSELAKGKDLIYLDFFYLGCRPCEYLLDFHLEFYKTLEQSVKDRILMIMIDKEVNEQPAWINEYRKEKNIPDEIITVAKGLEIFRHVDNNGGTPHAIFLDGNLIAFNSSGGGDFERFVEERVMGKAAKTAAQAALSGEHALLPGESEKRRV